MVKHPCQGCVYFKACGETNRTVPCYGRKTKREQMRQNETLQRSGIDKAKKQS